MNPMYYILIGIIVLVIAVDFYVKNKNKKSDSIDIDFPRNISKPNNFLIISAISVVVIIISFFSANYYLYDGELTNSDDGISLIDNVIYQKLSMEDLVENTTDAPSDSSLFSKRNIFYLKKNMVPVSCIVRKNGKNLGLIVNGFKEGLWREWYENGQLSYEICYKKGVGDELCRQWHENGNPSANWFLINGNPEGLDEQWYEDGQIKSRQNWIDGKKVSYVSWYDNGKKRREEVYGDNSYEKEWDSKGFLIEKKLKYNFNFNKGKSVIVFGNYQTEALAIKAKEKFAETFVEFPITYFFLPSKSNSNAEIYQLYLGPIDGEIKAKQWSKIIGEKNQVINF